MKLPLPWPKKNPMAWIMAIRENTTPKAPVAALLFSIPTKKVSARLYTAVTSMEMMVGTAISHTSLPTGSVVRCRYFSS